MRLPRWVPVATALVTTTAVAGCDGSAPSTVDVVAGSATPSQAPISPRIPLPTAATPATTANGFPLGTAVGVDYSYTVAVTAVSLDAAAVVAAAAPGATAANGRFVLVDLTATITEGGASQSGVPAFDLVVSLHDGAESYGQCDGADELLRPGVVDLGPGQSVSWQVCLDVPPAAAVPTSVIEVSDFQALLVGGSPVSWTLLGG